MLAKKRMGCTLLTSVRALRVLLENDDDGRMHVQKAEVAGAGVAER